MWYDYFLRIKIYWSKVDYWWKTKNNNRLIRKFNKNNILSRIIQPGEGVPSPNSWGGKNWLSQDLFNHVRHGLVLFNSGVSKFKYALSTNRAPSRWMVYFIFAHFWVLYSTHRHATTIINGVTRQPKTKKTHVLWYVLTAVTHQGNKKRIFQ